MEHNVCKGECKGVSGQPGVCQGSDCSKKDQPLQKCSCDDGKHEGVVAEKEESAEGEEK